MDPTITALLGLGFMFLLIALHVPIGVAMGVAGLGGVGVILGWPQAFSLFSTEPTEVLASMELAVVPLFLLMGSLAGAAGLSADLYRVAHAWVGHRRGGLAIATIGGCAGFGAVCGSSIATAATMARVALPEMLARNYQPALASGCIAAGGTLGMLIPPSVIMVIYAVLTEQFLLALFMAAIIPGLIAVLLHIVAIGIYVRINPEAGPASAPMPWRERFAVTKQCWAVLILAIVVSGGIYSGIFVVSEAAAVGAAMALFFAATRGRLTKNVLWDVLGETASNTGLIYVIVMGASIFTYFITLSQFPDFMVEGIKSLGLPPLVVIFMLHAMFLLLGSIFDTVAAMVITLPFVYPLIVDLGYSPIWWGVINVMVIEIGMITPPIGINVFVLHGMAKDIPLGTIFKGIVPFLIADLIRLTILTVFPILSLWLPEAVGMSLD